MINLPYQITAGIYTAMLLVFAFIARKSKANPFFGIRTAYAMEYPQIWEKTHRFYRVVSLLFAVPCAVFIFLEIGMTGFVVATILFLLPTFLAAFYSFLIGRPYEKRMKDQEKTELDHEIKKEQGYR